MGEGPFLGSLHEGSYDFASILGAHDFGNSHIVTRVTIDHFLSNASP